MGHKGFSMTIFQTKAKPLCSWVENTLNHGAQTLSDMNLLQLSWLDVSEGYCYSSGI